MLFFVKPEEEPVPTVDGAVEVGTKIPVAASATAHDVRAGRSSGLNGCGVEGGDGCEAALTRDGVTNEIESRWSCAPKLVEGGGPCRIEYTFTAPQDIVDIQVAFRKANERTRTLDVSGRLDEHGRAQLARAGANEHVELKHVQRFAGKLAAVEFPRAYGQLRAAHIDRLGWPPGDKLRAHPPTHRLEARRDTDPLRFAFVFLSS